MDTLQYLRAEEVFGPGQAALSNQTRVVREGDALPAPGAQSDLLIPEALRAEWGDFVWWDAAKKAPRRVTRDEVGARTGSGEPLLEGAVEVALAGGGKVACRPVFDLLREYARELAHADGLDACRQALQHLLEWYVRIADAAQQLLFPGRRVLLPSEAATAPPLPFADDQGAFQWLVTEHANLVAAVGVALVMRR